MKPGLISTWDGNVAESLKSAYQKDVINSHREVVNEKTVIATESYVE